jgi:hypothetical protein
MTSPNNNNNTTTTNTAAVVGTPTLKKREAACHRCKACAMKKACTGAPLGERWMPGVFGGGFSILTPTLATSFDIKDDFAKFMRARKREGDCRVAVTKFDRRGGEMKGER